jgi:hypothetical protein
VQPCINCVAPLNATLANEIEELGVICGLSVTLPPAGAATATGTATNIVIATPPPITSFKTTTTTGPTASSTATSLNPTQSSTSGSNGLSGGAIGGIVGGIVGMFSILAGFMIWWIRRRGARQSGRDEPVVSVSSQPIPVRENVQGNVVGGGIKYPEFPAEETPAEGALGARLSRGY